MSTEGALVISADMLFYIPLGILVTLGGVIWAVAASVTNTKRDVKEVGDKSAAGIQSNSDRIEKMEDHCATTTTKLFTMAESLIAGQNQIKGELSRMNGGD
jgi:hypothetical protein